MTAPGEGQEPEPEGAPLLQPLYMLRWLGICLWSPSFTASVQSLHYLLADLTQDHCSPDFWPWVQTQRARVRKSMDSGEVHYVPSIRGTTDEGWPPRHGWNSSSHCSDVGSMQSPSPWHPLQLPWPRHLLILRVLITDKTWIPGPRRFMWWWRQCLQI